MIQVTNFRGLTNKLLDYIDYYIWTFQIGIMDLCSTTRMV